MGRFLAVLLMLGVVACDDIEERIEEEINDEAAPLSEPDLPNCSRVVNCCTKLNTEEYTSVVPEAIYTECSDSISPAAQTVIGEYQRESEALADRAELTDEERASLQADLTAEWQDRVEPGCRCFVEETVGQIPALATPLDCEHVESSGALDPPATCDDATEALLEAAAAVTN